MKKHLILLGILISVSADIYAQSFAFGIKSGLTASLQRFDGFGNDPLLKAPIIGYIESDDPGGSVFAQFGYHTKGAANIPRQTVIYTDPQGNNVSWRPQKVEYEFNNLSLVLGFKKKYPVGNSFAYYLFGVRGDYTVSTNFEEFKDLNNSFFGSFPSDQFVQPWNYGVTIGGGWEFPFTDLFSGTLEFTVNPDFSRQYFQPPIQNVINPFVPGGPLTSIPERRISNIALEVTLGLRFLHKVIYED